MGTGLRGLEDFIARMDGLSGETEPRPEQRKVPGISGEADRETLLRYIRSNRWSEATETLNRLLAATTDETKKRKLKVVEEKISNLEFEQAEKLFLDEG
jgi:hypothetical protein